MKIGIFMGQISADSQRDAILGIRSICAQRKIDMHIFALNSYYKKNMIDQQKVFLSRVGLSSYDGFIIYSETIYDYDFLTYIFDVVKKYNKPVVSIDGEYEGVVNVESDNVTGMRALLEHLINDHGVRTINYVSAPFGSHDGNIRTSVVKQVLAEHGLELEKDRFYEGNYTADSGAEAVEAFNAKGLLSADAYVCGNDKMALGVMAKLEEFGKLVPNEIIVTGFDNVTNKITSVSTNKTGLGINAIQTLLGLIENTEVSLIPMTSAFLRKESCCGDDTESDTMISDAGMYMDERSLYAIQQINLSKYISYSIELSASLDNSTSFTELASILPICMEKHNITEFCLCLDRSETSNMIDVPFHYVLPTGDNYCESFKKSDGVPEMKLKEPFEFVILIPLHTTEEYFGFVAVNQYMGMVMSELPRLMIQGISNTVARIYTHIKNQELMRALRESGLHDSLTKLMNRKGFFDIAEGMMEDAKSQNIPVFIIFADLDGLKKVNDGLGHALGDKFICDFADIIKDVMQPGQISMRFGGDEFVIFSVGFNEDQIKEQIHNIHSKVDKVNSTNTAYEPYKLGASIGSFGIQKETTMSLLELIDAADELMYQEKLKKKSMR